MDFLRNKKHATNRNWHWALDQYVSPKNSIKICQKYVKVVEYWHGTIKNYRYDGDVSAGPDWSNRDAKSPSPLMPSEFHIALALPHLNNTCAISSAPAL